jgi:pentatricopeptide repeat protein
MQGLCHLSRRWHQQFCRSPSFLAHRKCLERWQPVRYYIRPPKNPPILPSVEHGGIVVREYEQVEGDPKSRRKEEDVTGDEKRRVRQAIKDTERELAILKQGPFSRHSPLMQSLPTDEREALLKEMEAEGLGDDTFDLDDLLDEDFSLDDEGQQHTEKPLAVTLRIPAKHKAYVQRFNTALSKAQESPASATKKAMWVWYLRCQQKVPGFTNFISEDVWDFLWQTQTELDQHSRHVVLLAQDMELAGVDLRSDQFVTYLEALRQNGDLASAVSKWESKKDKDDPAMLRLGVQLYATIGRPTKAQRLAMDGLESHGLDNRSIVSVIGAWADSQNQDAPVRLWTFYLTLKGKLARDKQTVPVDLLGQLTSVLLKSGRQDMALAVFKDMIATRGVDTMESMQVYRKAVGEQGPPSEDDINRIGLNALLTLPNEFKNKFFFGAWIKWLLGEGKVEDATLVVELMQEKGIRPDSRHLNGIIGAWLRQGSGTARKKAEQIAWGMIHARVDQVKQRGRRLSQEDTDLLQEEEAQRPRLPRFMQRNLPPATIETFSILLQRYTRQADLKMAEQLTDVMVGPAQIKPNSFILNHWLYQSLRANDLAGMWARYDAVRAEIRPDLETFACLWDGERRNMNLTTRTDDFPKPRQLYREMVHWYEALPPTKQEQVRSQFNSELHEQIVRCFCLHSDLPGTFVALQHMHDAFGLLPREDAGSMIVMQVARMMPADPSLVSRPRRVARRHRQDELYRAMLGDLANLMNEIFLQKVHEAEESSGRPVDLEADSMTELVQRIRLDAAQSFICLVLLKMSKQGNHVDNDLVVSGRAVGVELDQEMVKQRLEEAVALYEQEGGH